MGVGENNTTHGNHTKTSRCLTTDEMIFGKYYEDVKKQRKIESDLETVANDAETVFGEGTTQLLMAYYKLNSEGRNKAIDNIEDLSELYKYQKQD